MPSYLSNLSPTAVNQSQWVLFICGQKIAGWRPAIEEICLRIIALADLP